MDYAKLYLLSTANGRKTQIAEKIVSLASEFILISLLFSAPTCLVIHPSFVSEICYLLTKLMLVVKCLSCHQSHDYKAIIMIRVQNQPISYKHYYYANELY